MLRQIAAGERAGQRGHRQQIADQVAAGVAHEQPGGRPVVPQKPHQRPDDHQQQAGHEQLRLVVVGPGSQEHHGGEHGRGDGRHAGRQPVHVVQHVERVDQPDDPQHAQRAGEPGQIEKQAHPPMVAQRDHGRGHGGLHAKPQPPIQPAAVVGQAQQHQHGAAGQQLPELARLVQQAGTCGAMNAGRNSGFRAGPGFGSDL